MNGGAAGLGKSEEYYGNEGAEVDVCNVTLQAENASPRVFYIPKNTSIDVHKMLNVVDLEGHALVGYKDEACTEVYDYASAVTEDVAIYWKWQPIYSVNFNSAGGSEVASQTIILNNVVQKPSDPTKEGYTFAGWYADEACSEAYDFATAITQDTTIYAKWEKNKVAENNDDKNVVDVYTINFHANGGTKVAQQKVEAGKTVTEPGNPKKANCGFGGWYTDKTCQTPYDFTTKVMGNVDLYAKWYTVKLNVTK